MSKHEITNTDGTRQSGLARAIDYAGLARRAAAADDRMANNWGTVAVAFAALFLGAAICGRPGYAILAAGAATVTWALALYLRASAGRHWRKAAYLQSRFALAGNDPEEDPRSAAASLHGAARRPARQRSADNPNLAAIRWDV